MNKITSNLRGLDIPVSWQNKWQKIVDVLAVTLNVHTVMIMIPGTASSICSSHFQDNSEKAEKNVLLESILENCPQPSHANPENDQPWRHNLHLAQRIYHIDSIPLNNPGGDFFAWLCIVDDQQTPQADNFLSLLQYFKETIENDLVEIRKGSSSVLQPPIYQDAYLQNLFTLSQDCILLISSGGKILDANDLARKTLVLRQSDDGSEACLTADCEILQKDEHRIPFNDYIQFASTNSQQFESKRTAIIRRGESPTWFNITEIPYQPHSQKESIRIWTLRDINPIAQNKKDIAWNVHTLKNTQQIARPGNWEMEIPGKYMYWSEEMHRLFGLDDQKVQPNIELLMQHIHPSDRELLKEAIDLAIQKNESFNLTLRVVTPDAQIRHVLAKADIFTHRHDLSRKLIGSFQEVTEQNLAEDTILRREEQQKSKLDSPHTPDIDLSEHELSDIIDTRAVQYMLEDFTRLTGFVTAILDIKGRVVVATGWQDICTLFHRANPQSAINCTESDLYLAKNTRVGEYVAYKCKNQLWDIVTPLYIDNKHVGNIYTGQFFYEDEDIRIQQFEEQAERYGYNKDAYLAALKRVPRISRDEAKILMDFLTKFSALVSHMGYSNLKLAHAISEQKIIESALRESESHFRALTNQAPIPILIKNDHGKIEYINEKFTKTYGYALEDIPDIEVFSGNVYPVKSYHADNQTIHAKSISEIPVSIQPEIYPLEFKITDKSGGIHDIEVFGTHIGNKQLFLLNDITDRKRLEETLIQREKLVGIGTLAAGITHEMNSPLQVITGVTESSKRLLEEGNLDSVDLLHRFNLISNNAWRLARIVRSLLDYAHYAPGDNAALNSINELVRQTLTLTEHQFKSWSNISINTYLAKDLPMTVLDGNQITQVIINLLTNARDAMPHGGKIDIYTSFEKDSGSIILRIADSGKGIPTDIQNKIFDPFFTTKPIGEGTGLGLSIIAGIIRGHHGSIELEKSDRFGTIFKIKLPVVNSLPLPLQEGSHGRY